VFDGGEAVAPLKRVSEKGLSSRIHIEIVALAESKNSGACSDPSQGLDLRGSACGPQAGGDGVDGEQEVGKQGVGIVLATR
jgi:hypothetical protein